MDKAWRSPSGRPRVLYSQVAGHLTRRKLYLIGTGVFRASPFGAAADPHLLAAVEVAERYADGLASEGEFVAAREAVRRLSTTAGNGAFVRRQVAAAALWNLFSGDVRQGVWWVVAQAEDGGGLPAPAGLRAALCEVIREVAGDPFRPWAVIPGAMGGGLVQPDGLTVFPSVAARELAAAIAAGQAFDRLPVLADALEDAGVTDPELLLHCRRPGGHRRGCWAVDVAGGRP